MDKFRELFTESKKEKLMYAREIADKTGTNMLFLQDWMDDEGIDYYDLMQAVGQKKVKPMDLVTALQGGANNDYTKKIKKIIK